jgi:hypothetical protein
VTSSDDKGTSATSTAGATATAACMAVGRGTQVER